MTRACVNCFYTFCAFAGVLLEWVKPLHLHPSLFREAHPRQSILRCIKAEYFRVQILCTLAKVDNCTCETKLLTKTLLRLVINIPWLEKRLKVKFFYVHKKCGQVNFHIIHVV